MPVRCALLVEIPFCLSPQGVRLAVRRASVEILLPVRCAFLSGVRFCPVCVCLSGVRLPGPVCVRAFACPVCVCRASVRLPVRCALLGRAPGRRRFTRAFEASRPESRAAPASVPRGVGTLPARGLKSASSRWRSCDGADAVAVTCHDHHPVIPMPTPPSHLRWRSATAFARASCLNGTLLESWTRFRVGLRALCLPAWSDVSPLAAWLPLCLRFRRMVRLRLGAGPWCSAVG